ncbi:MAG: hypothetical protein M1818_005588 [Claussenomyces sp. TS43310]|nr:MAG: hypothetical protein M1818_005588 [Claussenomyces sp. TS43310]
MSVPALGMSQTKEELLRHLDMRSDTYNLMAKETDDVYKWLTSDSQHLKKNCTRDPPYDWNDITERAKHEAVTFMAQSGDERTSRYWALADESTSDGYANWIARWFLYHKFRYRDRRNRNRDTASSSTLFKRSAHRTHHSGSSQASHTQDELCPNYEDRLQEAGE